MSLLVINSPLSIITYKKTACILQIANVATWNICLSPMNCEIQSSIVLVKFYLRFNLLQLQHVWNSLFWIFGTNWNTFSRHFKKKFKRIHTFKKTNITSHRITITFAELFKYDKNLFILISQIYNFTNKFWHVTCNEMIDTKKTTDIWQVHQSDSLTYTFFCCIQYL